MSPAEVHPPPSLAIASDAITGLVLAGGQGSRMGGVDKGLQHFHGTALARHALQRLSPQVGRVAVNANRHLQAYRDWGAPVWPDALTGAAGETATVACPGYAGPLAGMRAGLIHCTTPWLVTVPCDTPRFPPDLVRRLAEAASAPGIELAVASAWDADTGSFRPQPVFCLLRRELHPSLAAFMAAGGRKVGAWMAQHRRVEVRFDRPGDDPSAFFNANTLDELRALEASD